MSQSNFVSSIPNNKLEPVFLGGGSGPNAKSSGTYVPVFLRNKEARDNTITEDKPKEFKMAEDDFPSLLGNKSSSITNTADAPKAIAHYSDALKKDIDKPTSKVSKSNGSSVASCKKKRKQRILDDYSDEYSDDGY